IAGLEAIWVPQKIRWPHVTSCPPNAVRGSTGIVTHVASIACVVSVKYASVSAPRPLTSPAPCVKESYSIPASSRSRVALYCSIALIAFAVGYGGGTHWPEFIYRPPYSVLARS